MTEILTGALFAEMVANGAAAIELHKEEVNELNVFPVPDGDTGTNMSLTMSNGAAECRRKKPVTLTQAADAAAGGLLRGARGNSGVILSLLFRGMAKSFKEKETAGPAMLAAAMASGVETAYKAVMKPAEGTILTVSRLASAAAVECAEHAGDLETVLLRALEAGEEALADTINLNPVLKKAGVIDSGGKGYLYILDGMLKALRGETIEVTAQTEVREKAEFSDFDTEDIHFAYCTEFIVERENDKDPDLLREFLSGIGDSIVVVDDDEIIKTHVHTNEPGNVLTEALTYGSFLTVKIENMKQQHTHKVLEQAEEQVPSAPAAAPAEPEKAYGIVSVCAGDGMAQIFRDLGVDAIVTGGQTMNPSTEDILKQVESIPAETVFVLPNNKNIIMAAQQCQPLTDKKVVVIPTGTVPQGISAAVAFDAFEDAETNEQTMTEAAGAVRTAQITYAARDSEFDGQTIRAGEYLSLLDGTLAANDADIGTVVRTTIEKIGQGDPELVTVFYGEDVTEEAAAAVGSTAEELLPDAEISVLRGGQPVYYYVISAE
ncbi:MAG: DAK2 domain-containing protein [Oscillospiraceae bacterium]|nr:DAK2 domain-containing protein [Oscillospiraceae bacterium]